MPKQAARVRRLLVAAVYAAAVALVVTTLAYLIRVKFDPLVRFDEGRIVDATSYTRHHEGILGPLLFWQAISQPLVGYLVVGVPSCLYVWLRRHRTTRAWWAFLTMMVGWMLALGLKYLVQRARPVLDDPLSQSPGYSFPSGHAANAAVLATALTLLFWPMLSRTGRRVAVVLAAGWVSITCLDRVLLGVHYPSDVIGGVLLGCGLVIASHAGYRGWTPGPRSAGPDSPDPPADTVDRSTPADGSARTERP